MRSITTLILIAALSLATAQVPGDTLVMDFETGATLVLDSVYPAGCWQVGGPNKVLFTSALSLPNALVTDTVQPYPSNTTCYAEFTLLADELDWNWGRWLEFDQWVDLAPGSKAFIEARDTWAVDWTRLNDGWYYSGSVVWGTEGYEFVATTGGWEHVIFDSPCIGVLDGGNDRWYDPLMRIRFVLEAGDNSSGHDGWMIDDFRATATPCGGGFSEYTTARLSLTPNPAIDRVLIDLGQPKGVSIVQVFRSDGQLVTSTTANIGRVLLDVSHLPVGPYLIRTTGGTSGHATLIVQR